MTGDSISGDEAVRLGWANRAFPAARPSPTPQSELRPPPTAEGPMS
jgi:enoyl-CoA hydratase/carnithine racemase